ncbi:MAG: Lrp/AsnC family transcriptional regulator [Thermoprotei archaeon]|nr:MAG: Lrp/AsnC family transcriptional regulator [Thermoprotei archaeon]
MLDELDKKIVELLQRDGRIPLSRLAKKIKRPRTTVNERVARLEKEGYILGYRAVVDPVKLGYNYSAIVMVKVKRGLGAVKRNQIEIAEKIIEDCRKHKDMPFVEEACIVTGEYDIALKIWIKSWNHLTNFLIHYLAKLDEIASTETFMILEKVPHLPQPFPTD